MFKKMNPLTITTLLLWLAALIASTYVPLAALGGSYRFMLSGINVALPIAGGLFSLGLVSLLISALWLLKILFLSMPITIGIPSACAMLSWASAQQSNKRQMLNFVVNALLPAACMAIFIVHPTVGAAWPYALYWLIPVGIYATKHSDYSFLQALQSTFVAHAVGSIMWLFLIPMTAGQWLALIPMVAMERLGIAFSATCLQKVISVGSAWLTSSTNKSSLKS